MKNTKIRTINSQIKQYDTWNEQFKQAVIASNKLSYEALSGLTLTDSEIVSCAELAYTRFPCKENFAYFINPSEANFNKHLKATKKMQQAELRGE